LNACALPRTRHSARVGTAGQLNVVGGLALMLFLTGCSNEPAKSTVDGHSDTQWLPDQAVTSTSVIATHTYTCDQNRIIAIQYLGDGLSLLLHTPHRRRATRLQAPRQGSPFYGPRTVLTLHGQSLVLREDGVLRRCERD
jgi:hypothetical protein